MKYAILIFLVMVMGCGKQPLPASRLSQPAGRFSFVTPDGWFRSKLAGIDYMVVSGPADSGLQPNIFTEGVALTTNVGEVAAGLMGRYKANYPAYAASTQVVFSTAAGMTGVKIVAHRQTREALAVTHIHYVLPDRTRVIQVTCSCARAVEGRYASIFDAAMKSLETP